MSMTMLIYTWVHYTMRLHHGVGHSGPKQLMGN